MNNNNLPLVFKLVYKLPNNVIEVTRDYKIYYYNKNALVIDMLRDVINKAYDDFHIEPHYVLEIVKAGQLVEGVILNEIAPEIDESQFNKTVYEFINYDKNDLGFYIRVNMIHDTYVLK
jgi:hypothetical protein